MSEKNHPSPASPQARLLPADTPTGSAGPSGPSTSHSTTTHQPPSPQGAPEGPASPNASGRKRSFFRNPPKAVMYATSVVAGPLATLGTRGPDKHFAANLALWMFAWPISVAHSCYVVHECYDQERGLVDLDGNRLARRGADEQANEQTAYPPPPTYDQATDGSRTPVLAAEKGGEVKE